MKKILLSTLFCSSIGFMGLYPLFRPNLAHTSHTPVKESFQLQINDVSKKYYIEEKSKNEFQNAISDYSNTDNYILEDLLLNIQRELSSKPQLSQKRVERLNLLSDAILTVIITRQIHEL